MPTVHIIGAGPAGLMSATVFAEKGYIVHVYDQKKAAGRKFLVAGYGGFNLTHSEPIDQFVQRYDCREIQKIVRTFDNQKTVNWLKQLGIETYVGSSGKIFPVKGIKPIDLLDKWLTALEQQGVKFHYSHKLLDFNSSELILASAAGETAVVYEQAVFAFGGKSWSKTGSDGNWCRLFKEKGIELVDFQSSNSGIELESPFLELSGKPLKNIRVFNALGERSGELVFTDYGIEGAAIYHMNRYVRANVFPQEIFIDLKPNLSQAELQSRLQKGKMTDVLKSLKIDGAKLALLKKLDKTTYTDPNKLSSAIKAYPLNLSGFRPIDEVISSYGGVSWTALNDDLSLKKFPRVKCVGEMLNWDAPTGGYLLQGCFATGFYAAAIDSGGED